MSRANASIGFCRRAAILLALACCTRSSWAEPAYVALRSEAQIADNPVLLGDIADVLTDDVTLKQALDRLDVVETTHDTKPLEITQKQVAIRLRLAGYDSSRVRVVGAQTTIIESSVSGSSHHALAHYAEPTKSSLEAQILDQLAHQLGELWRVSPSRVTVSLLEPLPDDDSAVLANVDRIQVSVSATQSPGKTRPRISLMSRGELVAVWHVSVEALVVTDVVVLRKPAVRGEVLTEAHLEVTQRSLNRTENNVALEEAVGRSVRRDLPPGHLLRRHELTQPRQTSQSVVSPRDAVRIVVRKAGLTVIADGEALQSANVGDRVRVRNTRSGKIVVGKLNAAGEVELTF